MALTDGERALQIRVEGKLGVILILDLMHVLEKLWKAAYVFHPEGSVDAELWVLDRVLRILFGEAGQVVKGKTTPLRSQTRKPAGGHRLLTETALACTMTNTSPSAGRSPVGQSKVRAKT